MVQCEAVFLTAFANDEGVKLLFISGLHQNITDDGGEKLHFLLRTSVILEKG